MPGIVAALRVLPFAMSRVTAVTESPGSARPQAIGIISPAANGRRHRTRDKGVPEVELLQYTNGATIVPLLSRAVLRGRAPDYRRQAL